MIVVCPGPHISGTQDADAVREWVEARLPDDLSLSAGHATVAGLLTALASHQVDGDIVASARHDCADDAALVDLTAWASWSAARRAASRYLH